MATKKKAVSKSNKKPLKRTIQTQKVFLEALRSTLGNVSAASRKLEKEKGIKVARKTHYEWIEKYPVYKEAVNELPELEVEFYENALNKLIQDGVPSATIFALKAKGKHKGWIERQEIDHRGEIDTKLNLVIVDGHEKRSSNEDSPKKS